MKIGVISDTHGRLALAQKAIKTMGQIDMLVHLGDYCRDAIYLSEELQREIITVKGNCDFSSNVPLEQIVEVEGLKIYVTHGHREGVKWGYEGIIDRAKNAGVDVALFGHTHISEIFTNSDILFVNPGSIGEPRYGNKPSYAIIDIKNGKPYPYIVMMES